MPLYSPVSTEAIRLGHLSSHATSSGQLPAVKVAVYEARLRGVDGGGGEGGGGATATGSTAVLERTDAPEIARQASPQIFSSRAAAESFSSAAAASAVASRPPTDDLSRRVAVACVPTPSTRRICTRASAVQEGGPHARFDEQAGEGGDGINEHREGEHHDGGGARARAVRLALGGEVGGLGALRGG